MILITLIMKMIIQVAFLTIIIMATHLLPLILVYECEAVELTITVLVGIIISDRDIETLIIDIWRKNMVSIGINYKIHIV